MLVVGGTGDLGEGTTLGVFPNSRPLLGGGGDAVTWEFMTAASFIFGGTVALQRWEPGGQS